MRRSMMAIATGCVAACAASLWPVSVHAQEIKAGFSSATVSFSSESGSQELSNTERLTGFVGGVAFLLPGNSRGGVQIEALFHQKGARNLLRSDDQLRLTYVERARVAPHRPLSTRPARRIRGRGRGPRVRRAGIVPKTTDKRKM